MSQTTARLARLASPRDRQESDHVEDYQRLIPDLIPMQPEPNTPAPVVWVITGGIASGKSTAVQTLRRLLPYVPVFDADTCVTELYDDPEVLEEIATALGPAVVDAGRLRRDLVRGRVLDEPASMRALEAILHPRVRASFDRCCAAAQSMASKLLIADIPLYFEAGAGYPASRVVTVAVSPAIQLARLCRRSGWNRSLAQAMINLQLPLEEKILRADAVWWNQGPQIMLERQVARSCSAWQH